MDKEGQAGGGLGGTRSSWELGVISMSSVKRGFSVLPLKGWGRGKSIRESLSGFSGGKGASVRFTLWAYHCVAPRRTGLGKQDQSQADQVGGLGRESSEDNQ